MIHTGILSSATEHTDKKIDPRTKLLLMLIINTTLFASGNPWILMLMAAIPMFLLFASKKGKTALVCLAIYTMAVAVHVFVVPFTQGVVSIFVVMLSGMVHRMMPGLIMGYYLVSTTTVSEFIAAMERMRITSKITIPLSVMFRFFPTVIEEAQAISDAMRMRGVVSFVKNPIAVLEYGLVPLMMSTVRIGDELSAAALTRGLGSPAQRTNICKIGFTLQDIVLAGAAITAFVFFLMS